MPASLFPEMERNSFEDQRALKLALELSMLGLNNESNTIHSNDTDRTINSNTRGKKGQNTTECVPVPSSEHVAEIVGRQGCKIKALRAKTNTYIKTPVRGEEPVFVVTGRKEDVSAAKREIVSAAEHFSQIRAQRKNNQNGALAPGPNSNIPGQATIQVRVPYRVVGLVVGPKGATIKRIQQQTNTYIVTPSRDKEPVFEVTGLPENIESAQKEIEAHIVVRTGAMLDSNDENYSKSNGLDQRYTGNLNLTNGFVTSMFKSDLDGFVSHLRDNKNLLTQTSQDNIFSLSSNGSVKLSDFCPFTGGFTNGFGFYDTDEGLGDSPTFDPTVIPTPTTWPDGSLYPSSNLSRRSESYGSEGTALIQAITDGLLIDHPPARRIQSDPLPSFTSLPNVTTNMSTNRPFVNSSGSLASSPTDSLGSIGKNCRRECIVCFESDVVAALVPCGHNLFCLECASRICEKSEAACPICHQHVSQAIRIYS